jgi:adenosine deaminase
MAVREVNAVERRFIERMPKAELHVHLEGSVHPETLLDLGRKHGVAYPFTDLAGAREWFQFRDFPHFIELFDAALESLLDEEDHARVTYELAQEAQRNNTRYLEVTFTPASPLKPRSAALPDIVLAGMDAGAERAERELGVRMRFILDPGRNRAPEELMAYARWFSDNLGGRLVGFGLGGTEAGNPPSKFAAAFSWVRDAGGRLTLHAGETVGPESIREALAVGSERIGHGVRAIEDPALVRELAERGVVLEVSPTSNVLLGIYPSFAAHPFRSLHDAGVPLTINTDDPPMFNTTLTNEYLVVAEQFGYTLDELCAFSLRAVRAAFLPDTEREAMVRQYETEMAALRAERDAEATP